MDLKCKLCRETSSNVNMYCDHLKTHPQEDLGCPYVSCETKFQSISSLKTHLYRIHKKSFVSAEPLKLKSLRCNLMYCNEISPSRVQLITHLSEHIRSGTAVQCPIENCSFFFSSDSSFHTHLSRKHYKKANKDFLQIGELNKQSDLHFNPNIEVACEPSQSDTAVSTHEPPTCKTLDNETVTHKPNNERLEEKLAQFFLKLEGDLLLPKSTVEFIATGLLKLEEMSINMLHDKLEKGSMFENNLKAVLPELSQCLPSNYLTSSGSLRSTYMRSDFYKKNFSYIEPHQINIRQNVFFHYVPIKKSLLARISDASVAHQILNPLPSKANTLSDIVDGSAFKADFVGKHGDTLCLLLYIDDFGITNPIGASNNKHKITAVYYTIVNLYPWARNKDENMQLILLTYSADFNDYREEHLNHVVEEIKNLESEKLNIRGKPFSVRLFAIAGDNLGSNSVGGFVTSFRLGVPCCRVCTSDVKVLKKFNRYELRNAESFNVSLDAVLSDESIKHCNGVKTWTPFNELSDFHSTTHMPPCCAHDLLEGIVKTDLHLFLKNLCKKKKYFDVTFLNKAIDKFKFRGRDATLRPPHISMDKSISGTASQMWAMIRFLPVFLKEKVPNTDSVWLMVMKLRHICLTVLSPSLTIKQIALMNSNIHEYLLLRVQEFPDDNFKPKHHFLEHYAYLTMKFGPLVHSCTLRFESKHQFFKRTVRATQNFINVTKTLVEKHELHQAHLRSAGTQQLPPKNVILFELSSHTHGEKIVNALNACQGLRQTNSYLVTNKCTNKGYEYKKGTVVATLIDNKVTYCLVELIVLCGCDEITSFYFVLNKLQVCESAGTLKITPENSFTCTSSNSITHPFPLEVYTENSLNYIVPKHVT